MIGDSVKEKISKEMGLSKGKRGCDNCAYSTYCDHGDHSFHCKYNRLFNLTVDRNMCCDKWRDPSLGRE